MRRVFVVLLVLCVFVGGWAVGVSGQEEGAAGPGAPDRGEGVPGEEEDDGIPGEGVPEEDEGIPGEDEGVPGEGVPEEEDGGVPGEDDGLPDVGVPDFSVPPVVAGFVGSGVGGFVSVPAEPGVQPADGPFSDEYDIENLASGDSGEDFGIAPPVSPIDAGLASASGEDLVEVEVEYGPPPEGFEGLAPCAFGLPCGKSDILPAPRNLDCSANRRSVEFSWSPVAGADRYTAKVQLADIPNSAQTEIRTTSTRVVFTGLVPSTRYWVSVLAVRGGAAQHFAGVYCTTEVGPPWCQVVGTDWVGLGWRADSRVSRWHVARATTGLDHVDGRTVTGTKTTTVFRGLSQGQSYTFYFWWWNGDQWIHVAPNTSCTTRVVPAAPAVSCSTATASTLAVRWGPVAGATLYRVKRGNGWAYTTGVSHVFSGLDPATSYSVQVAARNPGVGWGPAGTAVCATQSNTLPAPTGLACSATSSTELRFSWNPVAGAVGYVAKVQLDSAGSAQTEIRTAATQATFTGLVPSTRYWLSVASTISNGDLQKDAGVNCTTLAALAVPVITCIVPVNTATKMNVFWSPVAGATRYRTQLQGVDSTRQENTGQLRVFTGLAPATLYTFAVQAGNAAGEWSPAGTADCRTPALAPPPASSPALSLSCETNSHEKLTLNWQPDSRYSRWYTMVQIRGTQIHLQASPHDAGVLSRTFTELKKDTTYILRLWGLDSNNAWREVIPSPQCTTKALEPPTITRTTNSGNTLTVHWNQVDGATHYQVTIQQQSQSGAEGQTGTGQTSHPITTEIAGPGLTRHTFTNLTRGTAYKVTVTALGPNGNDSAPAGHAADANSMAICTTTTNLATIDYTPAADVATWTVVLNTADGMQSRRVTFARSTNTITFTNLDPGTKYITTITTRSGRTVTPISSPTCTTTPLAPTPTCPEIADVDAIVWWRSSGAGFYHVHATRIVGGTPTGFSQEIYTTGNQYTVRWLAEGAQYRVSVKAHKHGKWSSTNNCTFTTLNPIPAGTLGNAPANSHTYGAAVLKGTIYAADKAIKERTSCASGMPSRNKLVALMLAIPVHEVSGAAGTANSPSPMTLSRYDGISDAQIAASRSGTNDELDFIQSNIRMYSNMTKQLHVRAYWHPGVGIWQLDDFPGTISLNHAERANIATGGFHVARHILGAYCNTTSDADRLNRVFKPWDCERYNREKDAIENRCGNSFNQIYNDTTDQLEGIRVESNISQLDGGITTHMCRWSSGEDKLMPCHLYDITRSQGYASDAKPEGEGNGYTPREHPEHYSKKAPLAKPFLSLTDLETGTIYAIWPKSWPTYSDGWLRGGWPKDVDVVSKWTTFYRAVKGTENVRCSPGRIYRNGSPISWLYNYQHCNDPAYYLVSNSGPGVEKTRIDFSGDEAIVEGWFDDSVPYAEGVTVTEPLRHRLQLQNCLSVAIPNVGPYEQCEWVDL